MHKPLITSFLLIAACLSHTSVAANPNEVCAQLVPKPLQLQIDKEFPGFRFLRMDDYTKEDIESEKQYHQGSECLAEASGDFFGDGKTTFAFILVTTNYEALIVVAHPKAIQLWEFITLDKWSSDPHRMPGAKFNSYLGSVPPGNYEDVGDTDHSDAHDQGWVENYKSKLPGIVFGEIESTGVAYFYSKGKWVHTYIED